MTHEEKIELEIRRIFQSSQLNDEGKIDALIKLIVRRENEARTINTNITQHPQWGKLYEDK